MKTISAFEPRRSIALHAYALTILLSCNAFGQTPQPGEIPQTQPIDGEVSDLGALMRMQHSFGIRNDGLSDLVPAATAPKQIPVLPTASTWLTKVAAQRQAEAKPLTDPPAMDLPVMDLPIQPSPSKLPVPVFAGQTLSGPTNPAPISKVPISKVPITTSPITTNPITTNPISASLVGSGLKTIQFDRMQLSDAMRLFATETGLNVICSAEAGMTEITVFLRDVDPMAALEAIVKANGLFSRLDEASGILRISTAKQYESDLTSFREEQTRVFTLLYPNPIAVAQVIGQIYGERVDLNMADADMDDLDDLSQRFNRFDLVDGRALGLGTFDSGNGSANGLNNSGLGVGGNLGGALPGGGLTDRSRSRVNSTSANRNSRESRLSAIEIQQIEERLASNGDDSQENRERMLSKGKASIYVSTIRRNNQIVVRTADAHSMVEIEQLILELDVPTPTVLLEVKVLRISLADGVNSAFEYFGGGDGTDAGYSDGSLLPNFPGANAAGRALASGLGVAGSVPGSLTFQVVDSNFQFRMQALESQSRVTALATPLILTANNEVSRIFVGDTLPFTVGFTPSQVVGGINSVSGAVAATPITELRDVGQSLLITPNINADRTVTLRVVEENSERVLGGASIPVPDVNGDGVTAVSVDTVRRRTVSGTMVAQDGMAVALGGLIEESVSDSVDKIPVLGNIPGLGVLFRRQTSNRSRSELVVVIRPYVFNTPSESAATSQALLDELSIHPNSSDAVGTMDTYLPCNVVRPEAECRERANLFRFHNVNDSRKRVANATTCDFN